MRKLVAFTLLLSAIFFACSGEAPTSLERPTGEQPEVRRAPVLVEGTGLEVSDPSQLAVVCHDLENAAQTVLSQDRLQAIVDITLRENGIKSLEKTQHPTDTGALSVQFSRAKNAFVLRLEFHRNVAYTVGEVKYTTIARTWEQDTIGQFGVFQSQPEEQEFFEQTLRSNLEVFINEFLKANGR